MKNYTNKTKKSLVIIMMVLSFFLMPAFIYAEENEEPTPTVTPTPTEEPKPTPDVTPTAKPITITLDKTTLELTVGESVTIEATVSGEDAIDKTVSYSQPSDSKNILTVTKEAANSNKAVIKALKEGEVTITVTSNADTNKKVNCVVKVKAKVEEEPKKSSDTTLKSLSVTNATLSPEFDPEVREYTLTLTSTNKPVITTKKNHNNQKVVVPNTDSLKNGSVIQISVTAEDGTQNSYKLTVSKESSVSLNLKSLKIQGYTLNEPFSSSRTGYTVDIPYEAEDVVIEAEKESNDATVAIKGASNLKVGKNEVTITVKDNEGNSKVYIITVTREKEGENSTKDDEKDPVTSHQTSSIVEANTDSDSSSKDHTLKYILVTIGCLILFAIGILGIYFYFKTSVKDKSKKTKNKKSDSSNNEAVIDDKENAMIEVSNIEEIEHTAEFTEEIREKEDNKSVVKNDMNVLEEIEDLFEDE